jgi:hypothetical protein
VRAGAWAEAATPDGAGGVLFTYNENRTFDQYAVDIYAQRISSSGEFMWGSQGVAVTNANLMQENPVLVSDGWGGLIVAWEDWRYAFSSGRHIFAQRLSGDGIPGTTWPLSVESSTASARLHGFPNPTDGPCNLRLELAHSALVRVEIRDIAGRQISLIEPQKLTAGAHSFRWDGRDRQGSRVPAGMYLIHVAADGQSITTKLVVSR